ncbi:MAG: Sec-independent protein translocase subunit TatB [Campylobacterales bacterium]|nr:Sec-independent protein translocase subunit TatB [Campylobacterales bacterium]
MFGMGFTEILIILIIAILFLGPDKLPSTMVDIAKFFRSTKNAIGSLKDSFEHEMEASGIKAEALAYKKELEKAQEQLNKVTDVKGSVGAQIASITDDILEETDSQTQVKQAPKTDETVTFEKKPKTPYKDEIADV